MNRTQRRIQKRRGRWLGVVAAFVVMLGTTVAMGGAAFGTTFGISRPGGGVGGGYGSGGGAVGGLLGLAPVPGNGWSISFHGDSCLVAGQLALDYNGAAPAIVRGTLVGTDGGPDCAVSLGGG